MEKFELEDVKKGEVRVEVIVLKWESGPGDFMKNIGNKTIQKYRIDDFTNTFEIVRS